MSKIDITTKATVLANGMLQTAAALNPTLQVVTDNVGNSSTLLLGTADTQINSLLRINTDNAEILDIQDTSANNRFNINRVVQKINLDFASKPADITTQVGAIRTATDGVNLVDVMSFLENGKIGIGTSAPTAKVQIKGSGSTSSTTSLLVQNSAGTQSLKVNDDNNIVLGDGSFTGFTSASGELSRYLISAGTVGNVFGTYTSFNSSAIVQCDTTTRGFLPPRMTTAQRDAIVTPATGLQVYNTTLGTTDTYDGAAWQRFGKQTFIKGSGSTSSTTSLLVQNSASTAALTIKDDLTSTFNGDVSVSGNSLKLVGSIGNTSAMRIDAAASTGLLRLTTNSVNIGGNTTNNASALLQTDSTTQGFLPPRMTTAEKNAIATPAAGLIVYDSTLNKLCVRTAATWETITSV